MPEYITIHDTGNTSPFADAEAHAAYLLSSTAARLPVSWHFTVDGGNVSGSKSPEVYQHIPLNEAAFHAGRVANHNSIGIEICMNSDGLRGMAEILTADLIIFLLNTVPTLLPFPECMKQHWDWTGKNCPQLIRSRNNGWNNFLGMVESRMNKIEKEIKHLSEIGILAHPPSYWLRNAVPGRQVDGHFAQVILKRVSDYIIKQDEEIKELKQAGRNMIEAGRVFI